MNGFPLPKIPGCLADKERFQSQPGFRIFGR